MAAALVRGAPSVRGALATTSAHVKPAAFSTACTARADGPAAKGKGILGSLLHGSDKAKHETHLDDKQSHSTSVARGRYVHEIIKHNVNPGSVGEYRQRIGGLCDGVEKALEGNGRLLGSWEVTIGDLDSFFHIWEYEGYAGFDQARPVIRDTKGFHNYDRDIGPLITKRTSQICQEFAFWETAKPQEKGGIYEMRSYDLKPGSLLEWETEWRRGIDARRQFVEPIGAWFAQVGKLHTVHHMWRYPSMEARRATREQAWSVETWARTVSKTVKLTDHMQSNILTPLPHSRIR